MAVDDALNPGRVVRTEKIEWNGILMSCPHCGAVASWELRVQWQTDIHKETAWALCPSGHRVPHPLVYPQMVHRLSDHAEHAEDNDTPGAALQRIGWEPHEERWYEDTLGIDCSVIYVPFSRHSNPVGLSRRWPELFTD